MKLLSVVIAFGLVASVSSAYAGMYQDLTADQQAKLQRGEQVLVLQEVAGAAWPKVFVYTRVEATPEESAAVFADYELQTTFVPKLKKAKISERFDKVSVRVDYVLSMPWPLSDENYSMRDTLASYDSGASYRVDWKQIRADSVKDTTGWARFERLGTGTLFGYYNFVIPSSGFAGMIKEKAIEQVKTVANAMAGQITKERGGNRALLDKQLQDLRAALN